MSAGDRPVVVVVGSLHYDIMVEAPDRPRKGETVTGSRWWPKFGGKGGNQAVAAAEAGAAVRMVGAVGRDGFAAFLTERLARARIDVGRVAVADEAGSGMSVAIIDAEGDYGAVIVSGANLHIDPNALADLALWQDARALILQNEVPDAVNIAAARAAKAAGCTVCLNAAPYRPMPEELREAVDIVIVNALEAEALCGVAVSDRSSAREAAATLLSGFPMAVVTAGGDGVAGAMREAESFSVAALPVELVSTHGAGDVFVGALVAALAAGQGFRAGVEAANDAAARHVSTRR